MLRAFCAARLGDVRLAARRSRKSGVRLAARRSRKGDVRLAARRSRKSDVRFAARRSRKGDLHRALMLGTILRVEVNPCIGCGARNRQNKCNQNCRTSQFVTDL